MSAILPIATFLPLGLLSRANYMFYIFVCLPMYWYTHIHKPFPVLREINIAYAKWKNLLCKHPCLMNIVSVVQSHKINILLHIICPLDPLQFNLSYCIQIIILVTNKNGIFWFFFYLSLPQVSFCSIIWMMSQLLTFHFPY